jgi:hypothetical protein
LFSKRSGCRYPLSRACSVMPTANRSNSVSATSLGATVSRYLEAVASHAQATMKRVRLWIPGPVSMRTQFLAGTIQLDRSCWLRLLPQELRCSLVTGLPSARASLSPRLAKESATPSLSSQLNRSGLDAGKMAVMIRSGALLPAVRIQGAPSKGK